MMRDAARMRISLRLRNRGGLEKCGDAVRVRALQRIGAEWTGRVRQPGFVPRSTGQQGLDKRF